MKVYLCGPINGCSDDEAGTWRKWFMDQREDYLYPHELLWIDPMLRDYRGKEHEDYREIVELDKRDIRECNALVVMYTKPSVGTAMEVLFAWTLGIPVVVINESLSPISPWLRYHSTAIVKTKEEALDKLTEWLL